MAPHPLRPRLARAGLACTVLACTVLAWTSLACTGLGSEPPLGPDDPHPLPPLPATWDGRTTPAATWLAQPGERSCGTSSRKLTWRNDHTFLALTPKAKFGGEWRVDGPDIVYVTDGPIGTEPRCSDARFLFDGAEAPLALLCGQGPLGCAGPSSWAIEVIDAGGGPEGAALVARVLAGIAPAFEAGIVFAGEPVPPGDGASSDVGLAVWYRSPEGQIRRLAEHVATLLARDLENPDGPTSLGPLQIRQALEATSPIVIRVEGPLRPIVADE